MRKNHPYDLYGQVDFKEITLTGADSMSRYMIHINEMYESLHIIEQLIDNIPEGEYYIKQKPIIKVPEGQWWFSVEGGAGEFGVYLDSRGDKSPYRPQDETDGTDAGGRLRQDAARTEDRRPRGDGCLYRLRDPGSRPISRKRQVE